MAHKNDVTLIGLTLPLDMTEVIHLDVMVMMPETIRPHSNGRYYQNRNYRPRYNDNRYDRSDSYSPTIATVTFQHLADNDKVNVAIRADTRVITVPMVMLRIHTTNVVIEARIEVIVSIKTTSSRTKMTNINISHMVGMARTHDETSLLKHPLCQTCLASSPHP